MKLLIVSPDAYSIFHPETKFIFGGIEIETGHHAKGLAELGVEVTVATRDQGEQKHTVNGISIVPVPKLYGKGYWEQRQSFGGRLRYRLFGDANPNKTVEQMMSDVDPDAGYIMGMSPEAVQLARYCKANRRVFVFRVAHDKDLIDDEKHMQKWAKVPAADAREVIETATVVLSQTPFQSEELKRTYRRESVLMFPPIDLADARSSVDKLYDVLWIGRNNSFKRPEVFTEIASALPELRFCMIFNKVEAVDWERTVRALPSNVKVVESVPVTEIENYFASSRVFLSTSLHEGFPNTFLQAAKYGLPVVAMGSDPNAMLTTHGAGVFTGDDTKIAIDSIQRLIADKRYYDEVSDASRTYVRKYNDRKLISRHFYELLTAAVNQSRSHE